MMGATSELIFVTGNKDKLLWAERFLGMKLLHESLDLDEVQDIDPVKVLDKKAREAFRILGKSVLVEDTSLVFHALGRLPGPFIKFFQGEMDNNELCKLLNGFDDRSATQTVIFGIYDGNETRIFEGSGAGTMAENPRGENGFGFDSIFIPSGHTQTRGEMTDEEYAAVHPRRAAAEKLAMFMKEAHA